MKKYLILTLLMALANSAYAASPPPAPAVQIEPSTLAAQSHKKTPVPTGSQIVLITPNVKFIGEVNALGKTSHTGERLWLAITPTEHVEFLNGKIIRYASVEKRRNKRKAFFTPAIPFVMSAGSEDDYTGFWFFQADSEADALDAEALTIRLDGKECSITYAAQEKNYSLRCQ